MFRLEKVFQNDDKLFILISNFFKSFFIYIFIYLFSILEKNSIYDILNFNIYKNSLYFELSISVATIFLFTSVFLFKTTDNYYSHNKNIIKKDLMNLLLSIIISLFVIFFFENSIVNNNLIFITFFLIISLLLVQKILTKIYDYLADNNVIQKNILLIGTYEGVKKILLEKKNKIYVYKCCMLIDKSNKEIIKLRSELKIPIFNINEDVRSLLEYHSLGQIWILNDDKIDLEEMIKIVIKFSVDILIIHLLRVKHNINSINQKYSYENLEISKFYGTKLLMKILIDKLLSLFFLITTSPIILISMLIIFIEDGFPLFFTQDRTGWDGRRFKIFKLRSLKNIKFKKTEQVISGDKRLLKIGKFIRKFSIDELPQFFNVLKGDMSIVGPRPHMVEHDILYSNLFNEFLKRHKANPGLTGWAQINGLRGPTQNQELMKKRMEFDLWYLNNWSLYLDFKIILMTFIIIFKHKGV